MGGDMLHRIRRPGFDVLFLLEDGEDPGAVENIDAVIEMPDDSRWGATAFTLREVERLFQRWRSSGEAAGGLYLRVPDLILMREPGVEKIADAIADLIDFYGDLTGLGLSPMQSV